MNLASSSVERAVSTAVDRSMRVNTAIVTAHVRRMQRLHPDDSPTQVVSRLTGHYTGTLTASGAAIGATAAAPGVGTAASFALSVGDAAAFLETTALYVLAVAEVHGIEVEDVERRRALLMGVVLGDQAGVLVGKVAGHRDGAGPWARTVSGIPVPTVRALNAMLLKRFAKRYATRAGTAVFGRLVPFGVGAVVGGVANRALARSIVSETHRAFGEPPRHFPVVGTVVTPALP